MADFERLIRGALAQQDATSLEIRKMVYQSSRNALQKIIDSNRSLTVEAVVAQKRQLENSIEKVEAEFLMPPPFTPTPIEKGVQPKEPSVTENIQAIQEPILSKPATSIFNEPIIANPQPQPLVSPQIPEPIPAAVTASDPLYEIQQILESTAPKAETPAPIPEPVPVARVNTPQMAVEAPLPSIPNSETELMDDEYTGDIAPPQDYYGSSEELPLGFAKRRKSQKRVLWTIIILLILGLFAWIAYIVSASFIEGSLFSQKSDQGIKLNPNSVSRQAESENYITVINASDLSSLVVGSQGKAEIVNQLNSEMIRISSVRDEQNRQQPAGPILIRLKPGVLAQISEKRVTVEIFAKSGDSNQAHFAIGCEFGGLTECGRKRFLAGSQPNASVFAFKMDRVANIDKDMFLTLSTDTTAQAGVTGKGDLLDIAYIRLSVDE